MVVLFNIGVYSDVIIQIKGDIMERVIIYLYTAILITGCCCWDSSSDGAEKNPDADNETYVTDTFRDDFNGGVIDSSVWQVATWVEHGGQTGTDRCYVKDGYLTLEFINNNGEYLSSAIQTRREFLYGKWEARLKVSSVPGVLNSMYTIDWDDTSDSGSYSDGTKQEIDIEFLTKSFIGSTGEVHAAVHAEGKRSFNLNPDKSLSFNPSSGFHVWGFEITPEYIKWYVDGEVWLTYEYSENDIAISAPYQLKFNSWSQAHWIGGPPESGTKCVYLIDWVQFTPYNRKK